ncbi:MAG: hypothetical protein COV36_03995 [Alphaproteobacteria bacterium CG11_big_fil_rev_8_21_14_0_20_44_7]|nr:MAG: hypothetical protein COV36_03995 [Alphaproteobacteria bacterium CG11_big_fil_rev_8_21_14_0_20_44_7]
MKNTIIIIALLFVTSCYSKPENSTEQSANIYSEQVQLPYAKTWEKAISYFKDNKIIIKTADKENGIIYGERDFFENESADCGHMGREKISSAYGMEQYNIFVEKGGNKSSRVSVNLNYSDSTVWDPLGRRTARVECKSSGETEQGILDYIKG